MVLDSSNSDSSSDSSGLSHDDLFVDPTDDRTAHNGDKSVNGNKDADPNSDAATKPLADQGAEDPQVAAKQELGDYELLREIGRGGMGIVYEAKQLSLEKRVAVKVLPFTGVLDQRIVRRFKNEAWAAAQLQHRNIVPVYQVGSERGIYYYAMRYIEGGDLSDLYHALQDAAHQNDPRNLKQAARRKARHRGKQQRKQKRQETPSKNKRDETEMGPAGDLTVAPIVKRGSTHRSGWSKGDTLASKHLLDLVAKSGSTGIPGFLNALVKMGIQAADALHYAHEVGIVHRDVKPSNLLLDEEGEVWVVDFGLAQIQDGHGVSTGMTTTGAVIGTLRYMSPEQALGRRVGVDHRTDIYSLGVTLYELLTLNRAFSGESREAIIRKITFEDPIPPRKLDRRIPDELETVVMKAISKNPIDRYQTAAELADDLRRFRDNEPIRGRRPSVVQRLSRWGHRNRSVVVSGVVALALTAIIAVAFGIFANSKAAEIAGLLTVEQKQKKEIEANYHRSEGLRFIANSQLQNDTDPGLALQLALAGSDHYPGAETNTTIVDCLDRLHEIHVFNDLSAPVGHVAFNRDSSKLIACVRVDDKKETSVPATIWDTETFIRIGELKSDATITSAAYARDNSRILASSSRGRKKSLVDIDGQGIFAPVMIFEDIRMAPTGELKDAFCFQADEKAFDPIGDRIVLPSLGHSATVYDLIGRGKLFSLQGHQKRVVNAAFSPGGKYLVTTSDDNTVRIWNAIDGEPIHTMTLWKDRFPNETECVIDSFMFTADENRLVTGSNRAGAHAWDLETGLEVHSDLHVGVAQVQSGGNPFQLLTFSRSGKEVTVRDPLTMLSLQSGEPDNLLDKAVASPDGRWFLVLSGAKELGLWDARTAEKRANLLGHESLVNHMVFAPNSQLIATASDDQTVRLWNVRNGHRRATLPIATHLLRPLKTASPDGETLAIAGLNPPAIHRVIDLENERTVAESRGEPSMTRFGSHFVSVLHDRVSVHSASDGTETASINHPDGRVSQANVSPDGSRVVMKRDKSVTLWMVDRKQLVRLIESEGAVNSIGFDLSGQRLYSVTEDGMVRIWKAESGKLLHEFSSGDNLVAAQISHDGSRLAAVTNHQSVYVWNLQSPEDAAETIKTDVPLGRILFSFDDRHLILYKATEDVIVCWDLEQNQEQSRFEFAGLSHVSAHPKRAETLVTSDKSGAAIWNYIDGTHQIVTESPMNHGGYHPDAPVFFLGSKVPRTQQMFGSQVDTQGFTATRLEQWNRESLENEKTVEFPVATMLQFEVASDGQLTVDARNRFSMTLYDTESKAVRARVSGHRAPISASVFSPSSDELITTSWDRNVSVWNVADGSLIRQMIGHRAPVLCVAAIGNDKFVTGDHDGECIVWNRSDGRIEVRFKVSESAIWHLDVDETRNEVLALTRDSKLHIRDLDEGRPVRFNVGVSRVAWAEYSLDASSLLIIPSKAQADQPADSGNFILVAPRNGQTINSINLGDTVRTSHFHPDGQRVVTLTSNGTTTLRNAKTGEVESTYRMPGVITVASVLSPDGEYVAIATAGEVSVWKTDSARQWMTIPRFGRESSPPHLYNPFVNDGESIVVVLKRREGVKILPLDPQETARSLAPRDLTEREKTRFLIEP